MNFIFNILLWIVGIIGDDVVEERLIARGRCREVVVCNNEVKVRFMNKEDAELFAKDLKTFLD